MEIISKTHRDTMRRRHRDILGKVVKMKRGMKVRLKENYKDKERKKDQTVGKLVLEEEVRIRENVKEQLDNRQTDRRFKNEKIQQKPEFFVRRRERERGGGYDILKE